MKDADRDIHSENTDGADASKQTDTAKQADAAEASVDGSLEEEILDLGYHASESDSRSNETDSRSSDSGHHSSHSSHHSSHSGRHSSHSSHHSSHSSHHGSHSSYHGSHSSYHSSHSGHSSGSSAQNSGSSGPYKRSKRLQRYAKQREGSPLPGIIVTLFMAAIVIIFDIFLFVSHMVPDKYIAPIVIVLAVLVLVVWLLTRNHAKIARFAAGTIIAVVTIVVLLYATIAMGKVMNTLNTITETETEVSYVGVYVLTEDTAQTLEDVADDTFGIVEEADRDVTDLALEQINEELDMEVATAEYAGPTVLLDALYGEECRCMVLNEAYVDVLSELDGYEDIEDRIRELARFEVVQETDDSFEGGTISNDATTSDSVFTIYISGVDSRTGLKARSRSDVNILATVNKDTHQILLVSTPRDYYVPLSISNGQKDKLTHAGIYGVQVSMDTLGMLYGIDVDYYFRVSFEGFEDIVDALGGVTVYSDYDFTTGTYDFTVGYNRVDGAAALAFAREHHAFADGDRQRGRNQMALISAIIDEATSPKILTNYMSVLNAAEDNMEMSIPYDVIAELVNDALETGAGWDVVSYSVTGSDGKAVPYSLSTTAYVMIPDEDTVETASEMMQAMLNGERISDPE